MLNPLDLLKKRDEGLQKVIQSGEPLRFMGVTNGVSGVNVIAGGQGKVGSYVGGWQSNAMKNRLGKCFPDMLYISPEEPGLNAKEINQHLWKAQQINPNGINYLEVSMLADLEQGWDCIFKTKLAVEYAIENGINLIHIEDQGPKKRCGHLGDKELNSIEGYIEILKAARCTITQLCDDRVKIIARTDAYSAKRMVYTSLIQNKHHREHEFIDWEKGCTSDGKYLYMKEGINPFTGRSYGLDLSIQRCSEMILSGYADYVWMETPDGDLEVAHQFIKGVRSLCPNHLVLGLYNHSPSFDWNLKFYAESRRVIEELLKVFPEKHSIHENEIKNWILKKENGILETEVLDHIFSCLLDIDREDEIFSRAMSLLPKGHLSNTLRLAYQEEIQKDVVHIMTEKLVQHRLQQFGKSLYSMGYAFHLITLPEFHVTAYHMYTLSKSFAQTGIWAYVNLVQKKEQDLSEQEHHYTYLKHQRATGTQLEADFSSSIGSSNSRYLIESTEMEDEKMKKMMNRKD